MAARNSTRGARRPFVAAFFGVVAVIAIALTISGLIQHEPGWRPLRDLVLSIVFAAAFIDEMTTAPEGAADD